jgi:hypothetical protein
MIKSFKKVLNVGCGGCTSICLSGGQKEVNILNEELKNALVQEIPSFQIDAFTIERQCNADFYSELDEIVKPYEAILSMACGAGVQFLADRYPNKPAFCFIYRFRGVDRDLGWFEKLHL